MKNKGKEACIFKNSLHTSAQDRAIQGDEQGNHKIHTSASRDNPGPFHD
jgi:hypothetical protein